MLKNKVSNSVERYDVKNNKWEKMEFMNIPRAGVGLCVFNSNYLFAFGGRDKYTTHLTDIESYDICKDIWREIDYARTDQWDAGAYLCQAHQISKDKIIIFGKSAPHSDEEIKSCYEFTPETGEFEESNHLSIHSGFINPGICYDDNLYYVGSGFKVHRYNLDNKKWSIEGNRTKNKLAK